MVVEALSGALNVCPPTSKAGYADFLSYLISFVAAGSMRKDIGRWPQTSPSICTGTRPPGDSARIYCAGKDLAARSRGLLARMWARISAHLLDEHDLQRAASKGSIFGYLEVPPS